MKTIYLRLVIIFFIIPSVQCGIAQDRRHTYHSESVGISLNRLVRGGEEVNDFIRSFYSDGDIPEAREKFSIEVKDVFIYQIATTNSSVGDQYAHLIIWQNNGDAKTRLLEVIEKRAVGLDVPDEITTAREQWMKYCNNHEVSKLVTEMYTENAIYYNRGRILRGHEALTAEYAYMANSSYSLKLTPKHIEMVSENLAYEIGVCRGSYNLPYMLAWIKDENGNWKVFMDSNY